MGSPPARARPAAPMPQLNFGKLEGASGEFPWKATDEKRGKLSCRADAQQFRMDILCYSSFTSSNTLICYLNGESLI